MSYRFRFLLSIIYLINKMELAESRMVIFTLIFNVMKVRTQLRDIVLFVALESREYGLII